MLCWLADQRRGGGLARCARRIWNASRVSSRTFASQARTRTRTTTSTSTSEISAGIRGRQQQHVSGTTFGGGAVWGFGAGVLCCSFAYSMETVATKQQGGPVVLDPYFISRPAEVAQPAVVNLSWSSKAGGMFGVGSPSLTPQSGGSGFIISKDGMIVTNAHVVETRRRSSKGGKLTITLHDGRVFPGEVVSTDPLSDLAIVKVDCKEDLPTVTLGDSNSLRVGEWVVALGSPLFLKNTITAGIISCVERKRSDLNLSGSRTDYIQTDASINMGNSGGPLVNLKGEVIGINAMKALSADGVSFAIPVDTAKFVIQQVLKYGRVVRPYIGIKMLDLSARTADLIRKERPAFPDVKTGVFVPQVTPGGPAENAGFEHGDVITHFDGNVVEKGEQIIELLGSSVGKRHQVVVLRDHGEKKVLYVTSVETLS